MTNLEWQTKDPREVIGYNRDYGHIIVYDSLKGCDLATVWCGHESWSVSFNTKEHFQYIEADDKWPSTWFWTYLPS